MYLTVQQVSSYLQVKTSTIYAWVGQGRIPFVKIHGVIRFQKEEIEQWVETFRKKEHGPPLRLQRRVHQDVDTIIARVKGEVYNATRGETKPESAQRKEI